MSTVFILVVVFSQSTDRLANNPPLDSSNNRQQHTAYILQPPSGSSSSSATANPSRNRVRDRKNQSSLRHGQKSSSNINSIGDEQSQTATSAAAMRSLDRKQARPLAHHSTTSKTQMKTSHTDIYGSLERNKHSKVSQPALHATLLNDENERMTKADNQAHDFYHLTSTHPPSSNTTSTIVNVGNALQQQQHGSFDHTDSTPPPLPPTSSTTRVRHPPNAVFQPHFDSSTTTPKDSYYTISGSKDVSPHPHAHIRGLVANNFYSGPYPNKPPIAPPTQQQQQQQPMQRYDTSPLLVRRLENMHPSQTRHQPQSYNRTQSSVMMTTSQQAPPSSSSSTGRFMNNNSNQSSSGLLFRPHSSQSSSSQSSG